MTAQNATYEKLDSEKLEQLSLRHAWIVDPIMRASQQVMDMPFFQWLHGVNSVEEFKPVATQLYYHSATFPKVMGIMMGLTSMAENHMMPFYAAHAFGEATHHEMLMQWMLKNGILKNRAEIEEVILTPETNACVNLAYQLAIEQDKEKWLATINSGIERCSNDFFQLVAPKMHALGVGDKYFDIHVDADAHHSIMGMEFIEIHDKDSTRGRQLIAKALEGISLWAGMLHSWIDVDLHPRFNLDGSLVKSKKIALVHPARLSD